MGSSIKVSLTTTSIQKLRKMGLLNIFETWLSQDSTKVKKSPQLQAFDALTSEEKVKAFDAMTPEDKLEVLDEQLLISERCAKVNFDYFTREEEKAVRSLKESIIQSMHINHINLESM